MNTRATAELNTARQASATSGSRHFFLLSYLEVVLQAYAAVAKEACALRQVQGLLKIRGELTKSTPDGTVALLLAVMAATVAVAGVAVAVVVVVGRSRSNGRSGSRSRRRGGGTSGSGGAGGGVSSRRRTRSRRSGS